MTYEPALNKAISELRVKDPEQVAANADVEFNGREFVVPFYLRTYAVRFPEIRVTEIGSGLEPPEWIRVLILHYLITADGAPIAGEWVAYRALEGGYVFEKAFQERAIDPLVSTFGANLGGFCKGATLAKGKPMDRTGDAAFWFQPFPRLLVACILYTADEELPASANIVFDAAANNYLPTEDLSGIGTYLTALILQLGL